MAEKMEKENPQDKPEKDPTEDFKNVEFGDAKINGETATVPVKNKKDNDVIVNQVGWAGLQLGRLDFVFEKKRKKNLVDSQSILVTKKN